MNTFFSPARLLSVALASTLLAGCASVPHPDPQDPLESYNRGVYKFNDTVDRAVFKPIAKGYVYVVPQGVRECVHNMFNNIGDIWGAANSFLQNRPRDGINMIGRVLLNTTMGVGGCFDIASKTGDPEISNDFATTLGVWGVPQGPYIVWPFLGSSTVRDTGGMVVDGLGPYYSNISIWSITNVRLRNSLVGLELVDQRASLLHATDLVDQVALDPYSFVRDAYLQQRKSMVLGHSANSGNNVPQYTDPDQDSGNSNGSSNPPNYTDPDQDGNGNGSNSATAPAASASHSLFNHAGHVFGH